jgi:hypothetical protein
MQPFNDPRDWFFQKRCGLFIHWSLYAIKGWHEQEIWRWPVAKSEYVNQYPLWKGRAQGPRRSHHHRASGNRSPWRRWSVSCRTGSGRAGAGGRKLSGQLRKGMLEGVHGNMLTKQHPSERTITSRGLAKRHRYGHPHAHE